jgi:hypothetical protein
MAKKRNEKGLLLVLLFCNYKPTAIKPFIILGVGKLFPFR